MESVSGSLPRAEPTGRLDKIQKTDGDRKCFHGKKDNLREKA